VITLIIALYNEENRVRQRYGRVREFLDSLREPWELILVDDGSRDNTVQILRELVAQDVKVRILDSKQNLGQGSAIKIGVLCSRGDIVLYSDADLPVPLPFAKTLIARIKAGDDVAIAARWVKGAKIGVPQPPMRRILGKMYYRLIHLVIAENIHDTNCGLKAYRGEAARVLFGFIHARRWAFNVEHLWLAMRFGYKVIEIPAEWSHQDHSKVHVFRDGLFTLWEVMAIKKRQILGQYPLIQMR
jgi:dolichyl-phosphate beta-glucosyltransferase